MPRLGHKKSRLGCRQCKARHVKCDELKPCTNCARHGVPCSLVVWDPNTYQPTASASSAACSSRPTNQSPPERPIAESSASSTPAAHTGYSRNPAGARAVSIISEEDSSDSDAYPFLSRYIHTGQQTQSALWLRDLELLHHWTTEAFDSLSQRHDVRNMWRVEAPKQANAHDYFMHEILAFAALHKAYQQPLEQRQPYYACGIHHQDLAIRGVRKKLHNVTNDEAPAIVATATLLTLSVFASTGFDAQLAPTAAAAVDTIDSIMNAFHLMQGMGHVLALAQAAVRESFIGPMLTDPSEPTASQPMLQEVKDRLPALTAFFEGKTGLPEAEQKLYLATIAYFQPALQISLPPKVDNRELRFLFFWPLHLDAEFMESLRQRRPGAIVILMYFAIVLIAAESRYWFMEDWGHRVMKACREYLDQSWMPAVEWPLSFIDQRQTWDLFADFRRQGQSSGPSTDTSSGLQQPTMIPQGDPTSVGSSTSHGEPPRPFSLQLRGTKYAVQMGSAVDKPVPEEG